MFSWFKKHKPSEIPAPTSDPTSASTSDSSPAATEAKPSHLSSSSPSPSPNPAVDKAASAAPQSGERLGWLGKLRHGLARTGSQISTVFTGAKIDEALYEDLESALLMSDAGVAATEQILQNLKAKVRSEKTTEASAVKALLAQVLSEHLQSLEGVLPINAAPTVIMVVGVNGAGKTTSIGKLTRHLSEDGLSVLLAAADTFRAAAKEQLAVWAGRNTVDIISQDGADSAAVSFDAVAAGKARGKDVVIVDTAGRLPTQLHLMDELKKIQRVIQKADSAAPHQTLLVIDGNTGQNALAQVKAFDQALGLTGLIVTKLDGTAKGGVLAAIALWAAQNGKTIPVYFIGVGEQLDEMEVFNAKEFAQALLG